MNLAQRAAEARQNLTETELCEVFVSHRSEARDVDFAETLTMMLRERGINCFLDVENIDCGESFAQRIIDGIESSQLVVVIFSKNISTWVHFEASCAYFEKKLFPVSLNDAEVPLPYSRVHYHTIRFDADNDTIEGLDRLVDAITYKLNGAKQHVGRTRAYRRLNRFFFSGFTIMFAVISAVILFGIDLNFDQHVDHLHVTLGSVIIGGQFFLSLGFARTVAHPSSRQRALGFKTFERLYIPWAIITLIQPILGLWLALPADCDGDLLNQLLRLPGWIWLSLVLYCLAVLCTWVAYSTARGAMQLDSATDAPYKVNKQFFRANMLFLFGFIFMVAVINLMISDPKIKSISAADYIKGAKCGERPIMADALNRSRGNR